MTDIIQFVQATGFPIVIALLFYLDFRSILQRNTKSLMKLLQQQEQFLHYLKKRG